MRKFLVYILFLVLAFSVYNNANAQEIGFEDVAKIFKETIDKQENDDHEYSVVYENNILKYYQKISSEYEYEFVFNYSDGIFSYKYPGDKNNYNDVSVRSITDPIIISLLMYSIGIAQGNTKDQMKEFILNFDFDQNHEDIGINSTFFDYDFDIYEDLEDENSNHTYLNGSAFDTFSINVKKFTINSNKNESTIDNDLKDNNIVEQPPTLEEDINDIENPQTGNKEPIFLIGFCIILLIIIFKRKNFIKKI